MANAAKWIRWGAALGAATLGLSMAALHASNEAVFDARHVSSRPNRTTASDHDAVDRSVRPERTYETQEVRSLVRGIRDGSEDERYRCALRLVQLGVGARSAMPDIVEWLCDSEDRFRAIRVELEHALAAIGVGACEAARALLEDPECRSNASGVSVVALGRFDPSPLAELLWEQASGPHDIRVLSEALARLGPGVDSELARRVLDTDRHVARHLIQLRGPRAVRALAPLILSHDQHTVERVVELLANIDNPEPAAPIIEQAVSRHLPRVPELLAYLGSSLDSLPSHWAATIETALLDPGWRIDDMSLSTHWHLTMLAKTGAHGVRALARMVRDSEKFRFSAANVLCRTGHQDLAQRKWFCHIRTLCEEGKEIRGELRSLVSMGLYAAEFGERTASLVATGLGHDQKAVWMLMREHGDRRARAYLLRAVRDPRTRKGCLKRWRRWPGVADDPELAEAIRARGVSVGASGSIEDAVEGMNRSLDGIESQVELLVASWSKGIEDREEFLEWLLARLRASDSRFLKPLARFQERASPAVPMLTRALRDADDAELAARILQTLGSIGPDALSAMSRVQPWTRSGSHEARAAALAAAFYITGEQVYALRLIEDLRLSVRIQGFVALSRADSWAVPVLLEHLPHPVVVSALRQLGPRAKEAIPALRRMLAVRSHGRELRRRVQQTLAAIETD